mgnify:CR=1 FL=1
MTPRTLGVFFILAFGLTWGIAALLILLTEPIEALFGEDRTPRVEIGTHDVVVELRVELHT